MVEEETFVVPADEEKTQVICTDMETQAYTDDSDKATVSIPEPDGDETQVKRFHW